MHWFAAILVLPYFFLLLKIYRSLLQIKTFKVSTDPVTFVSLVVACRNEQTNLSHLLDSFVLQDYPKNLFEVIIVDDNSQDKTFETASCFTGIPNIVALYNSGTGKKKAIRSGIGASSGELIITTDADCRPGASWIRTIAAFYEKHKPDMIICPVQIEPGNGFFRKFQQLEFLSLQGITAGTAISGNSVMCNGANLAFTRKTYIEHSDNLYDEIDSGDDIFFLHSLKKIRESKILWLESADALTLTAASPTFGSYLRQRRRWISKGKSYKDRFTILLGITALVTIILQASIVVAVFFNQAYIWLFLIIFLIKSFPDFLILRNTSGRYGRKYLMKWFLPACLIYPLYVLIVYSYSLLPLKRQSINSPSLKEI
jgi:cellulose synthase/poly-beta-1,6-N-acetylglucosamine synthase-like glycosyltransferase